MEVGAFEAKNRLSALLDEVAKGTEVVITRRGRPVAKLVRAQPGFVASGRDARPTGCVNSAAPRCSVASGSRI